MILLDDREIKQVEVDWFFADKKAEKGEPEVLIVKATGEKILIKLQAIYNIADLKTSDRKMGEFIQGLMEEVGLTSMPNKKPTGRLWGGKY